MMKAEILKDDARGTVARIGDNQYGLHFSGKYWVRTAGPSTHSNAIGAKVWARPVRGITQAEIDALDKALLAHRRR